MINRFLKKKTLIDIFIIFILSLTPLLWFKPGQIMVGHDNVFPLAPKTFLEGRLYTWNQNQGFGRDQSLIMGSIPIHLIDALPTFLGFSLQTTQKLVYIFWFFLIGFSVYLLASLINPKSRFFKLFIVAFYQFNFFVLQGWWIGERTKFSAYIALPLVLSVFFQVYRKKVSPLRAAIINSLILLVFNGGGLFGIPLYGGFFIAVGVFILFFGGLSLLTKDRLITRRLFVVTALTLVGFLLINVYYLLPAFSKLQTSYQEKMSQAGEVAGLIEWTREISANTSFINLFRLQGIAEWYDNPEHPYAQYFLNNNLLILISFLWPLLAFSSLIFIRDKKKTGFILYFFLIYLIGLFFTAGAHPPLGFLYSLLMRLVPGFVIFRTPYFKFAPAVFLANAFLCAFTLDFFKERLSVFSRRKLKNELLVAAFCFFWLGLWFGYHFPYFTVDFFSWREGFSTRLKIPNYVFEFSSWLNQERLGDGRILMLPASDPDWQYELYDWGYLSFQSLPRLFTNQPVIAIGEIRERERLFLDRVNQALLEKNKPLFKKMMTFLGIKYLLLRKDFIYDLDWFKTEDPSYLQEVIEKDFGYSLKRKFGQWELYEVDFSPLPAFFVFQNPDRVELPVEFLEEYYSLMSDDQKAFILNQEVNWGKEMFSNYFLAPECLTCGHETGMSIVFPKSKILPDSPFYPLVILKEKWESGERSPEAKIYHQLGLTLRRIGEIQGLTELGKKIKSKYLQGYLENIATITSLFSQIDGFKEKTKIAKDLDFFLLEEHLFWGNLIDNPLIGQKEAVELEVIIEAISSLRATVDRWFSQIGEDKPWVYIFKIEEENNFQILVNSRSIETVFLNRGELSLYFDGLEERKASIVPADLTKNWFSLGNLKLSKGSHVLTPLFPEVSNLVEQMESEEPSFWREMGVCFSSQVKNYDPSRNYLMSFYYYQQDFSSDPILFIIREGDRVKPERQLQSLKRQRRGFYKEIIPQEKRVEGVRVLVCLPEFLDKNLFQEKKKSLQVKEIVYPLVVLRQEFSAPDKKLTLPQINFSKINPTKYLLKISHAEEPYFLAFWQRFNPDWRLYWNGEEIFTENHFELNGHANGWLIDKKGDYDLVLEYLPQRNFLIGRGLTLSSLVAMIAYLLIKERK